MNRNDPSVACVGSFSLSGGASLDYDSADIATALERFGALLRTPMQLSVFLQSVCQQIVATMLAADMAAVTILPAAGKQPETIACTEERAFDVDAHQYRANEGPCLEAARTGQVVRARIEDAEQRWPAFAANVAGMGVASYLSVPLLTGESEVGALNLYGLGDRGFSEIDEVLLQVFVAAVEGAVWNARRAEMWRSEVEGMQAAMRTRGVIERAKGMLMVLHGIGEDRAFELLVQQSQRLNVRLASVATEIVDTLPKR